MWKTKPAQEEHRGRKYKVYFRDFIQRQASSKVQALNCSVTVMDGINTQFWAES